MTGKAMGTPQTRTIGKHHCWILSNIGASFRRVKKEGTCLRCTWNVDRFDRSKNVLRM
jgi:hypothetical protein